MKLLSFEDLTTCCLDADVKINCPPLLYKQFIKVTQEDAKTLFHSASKSKLGIRELNADVGGITFLTAYANKQVSVISGTIPPLLERTFNKYNIRNVINNSQDVHNYDLAILHGNNNYLQMYDYLCEAWLNIQHNGHIIILNADVRVHDQLKEAILNFVSSHRYKLLFNNIDNDFHSSLLLFTCLKKP